jgi:hypothetical protein
MMAEPRILNIHNSHDLAKLLISSVSITSPELSSKSLHQSINRIDFVYKKSKDLGNSANNGGIEVVKDPKNGLQEGNERVSSLYKKNQ